MRIAQVAPLYERVPPLLYGGTERVVSYLTEELVRLGHEVTLFASGDSLTQARLVAPCPRALRLDPHCQDPLAPHVRMLGWVYQQAHAFDVIHCHTDYLGLPLSRSTSTPTVLTLHGRLDIPELAPLYEDYPDVPLVSISDAQRKPLPRANWLATVYHGLPPDLYKFHPSPERYLLFLGRVSPEKRPDSAIRVACAAGLPLRIAAKVDKADREYFETTIRPLLTHPLVEFLGEVTDAQKQELLGRALALLFPVDWPEPFGLVLIEALACGTPVIARRRGSVPEILQDGVTGILCETEAEMVAAVHRVAELDRRACRRAFEQRFTVTHMAQRYLQVYDAVCAMRKTHRFSVHLAPARGEVGPLSSDHALGKSGQPWSQEALSRSC
ncbi:MAG: glycosyltransferase family 4 protein [Candidatus Binatia bacterium]|nr:glycosyltransferase family 4 protein [Candidatus Binatia bacterium]